MINQATVLKQMVDFVRDLSTLINKGHISFPNASDAYWMAHEVDRILIETKASNSDFVHDAACALAGFDDILTPEKFRRPADYDKVRLSIDAIANRYAVLVNCEKKSLQAA